MEFTEPRPQHESSLEINLEGTCEDSKVQMRRHYHKLEEARHRCSNLELKDTGRPITCFVHPGVKASKLLVHLQNRSASNVCVIEWLRRLQKVQAERDGKVNSQSVQYGINMMGK